MDAHRARQEVYQRVAPLAYGAAELAGKDFQFRGGRYQAAEATRLLESARQELDQDYDWILRLDREVFLVHHDLARRAGDEARRELEARYRFHLAVQDIHRDLTAHNQQVQVTLNALAGRAELTQE